MKTAILMRILLTLGLLGIVLLPLACSGGVSSTALPPIGSASGLNTFVYVYSDT